MKEKIGFIGLGKLGLPVAMAISSKGYEVSGYDINPKVKNYIKDKQIPYQEVGMDELFEDFAVNFSDFKSVMLFIHVIYIC